jgi:colanic acid biosynthesis glycosyl transferase WcaI
MHDFASAMASRGHEVVVHCSSRGYDDPSKKYPRREVIDGVQVHRYALPLFSKTNMILRVVGSAWAMLALFFNALFTRRTGVIVFSTSPPLVGVIATLVSKLKGGVPRVYWAMDLNPDQLLAMGKLRAGSLTHRILEAANRFVIRNAQLSVPLDRFMDARLRLEGRTPQKTLVLPPWPHEDADEPLPHEQNWFRDKHNLQGRFVVMYSGNHSPANPLDTLLQATLRFRDDDGIRFAFIGGGNGKKAVNEFVERRKLANCLTLPYQPLSDLRFSLSAADAHVVSLGEDMVGIIHPCKVYGSMAVGRPILFLGPRPSHVSDLLDAHQIGEHVEHGDIEGCVDAIRRLRDRTATERAAMGDRAQVALRSSLSHDIVCTRLCEGVESLLHSR